MTTVGSRVSDRSEAEVPIGASLTDALHPTSHGDERTWRNVGPARSDANAEVVWLSEDPVVF